MSAYKTDTYYLAPSLVALFNEINARWPARDKASDGWIGDAAHAARRSDHNPDYTAGGVVRAIDVDKDGISVDELLSAVVKDPRVWYVIWNRRIASVTYGWKWQPYDGVNAHEHHVHISILHTRPAETNTARWFKPAPVTKDTDVISDEDVKRIAQAVYDKLEPRIQAYARYVTRYEQQTDHADATRAADEVVKRLDDRERKESQ